MRYSQKVPKGKNNNKNNNNIMNSKSSFDKIKND